MADLQIPIGETYLQIYPLTTSGGGDAIVLVAQRPGTGRNYRPLPLQTRA